MGIDVIFKCHSHSHIYAQVTYTTTAAERIFTEDPFPLIFLHLSHDGMQKGWSQDDFNSVPCLYSVNSYFTCFSGKIYSKMFKPYTNNCLANTPA